MARRASEEGVTHPAEKVPVASLKPHPRNYKKHPPEQIRHIVASLKQYGQFRNVVVARDDTILAGHGVVEAIRKLRWEDVSVVRLDLDPASPRALKLVALDNEVARGGESDDRALAEQLRDVAGDTDAGGLIGTGFDDEEADRLLRHATGNFQPGTADEQGSLDKLTPLKCPHCGGEVPRRAST